MALLSFMLDRCNALNFYSFRAISVRIRRIVDAKSLGLIANDSCLRQISIRIVGCNRSGTFGLALLLRKKMHFLLSIASDAPFLPTDDPRAHDYITADVRTDSSSGAHPSTFIPCRISHLLV